MPSLVWGAISYATAKSSYILLPIIVITFTVGDFFGQGESFGPQVAEPLFFGYLILCFAVVLVPLLSFVFTPFARALPVLAFGWEGILAGGLTAIRAVARPPCELPIGSAETLYNPQQKRFGTILHSTMYSDKNVISDIVWWFSRKPCSQLESIERRTKSTTLFWMLPCIVVVGLVYFSYMTYVTLQRPYRDKSLIEERPGEVEIAFERELIPRRTVVLQPSSHQEIKINVSIDFDAQHCHVRGSYLTDFRGIYLEVTLDDHFFMSAAEVLKNPYISEEVREKVRLENKPFDFDKKTYVFRSNDSPYMGRSDVVFENHPQLYRSFVKTGTLLVSNYDRNKVTATIQFDLNLRCYRWVGGTTPERPR